jgi:hypothetical protein
VSEEHPVARYRFVTGMRFAAPRPAVHAALLAPEGWLPAWADVVDVRRTVDGDLTGVGRVFDASVRAPLGYRLSARVEVVDGDAERPRVRATGDLDGEGRWHLIERPGGVTDATLDWDVEARPWWLRALSPVARPLFVRSHHTVVRHAAEAVASHLDAALLRCDSTEARSRQSSSRPI